MVQPRHILLTLLVLAAGAVDAALAMRAAPFPHVSATVLLGFGLAQVALLTRWLVEGQLHVVLRWLGCLLILPLVALFLAACTRPEQAQWLPVLWMYGGAVALSLHMIPVDRCAVDSIPARRDEGPGSFHKRRSSRSITAWFIATAIAGLSLMLVLHFPWAYGRQLVALVTIFAVVARLTLWSTAETSLQLARLTTLAAVIAAASVLLQRLTLVPAGALATALATHALAIWLMQHILWQARSAQEPAEPAIDEEELSAAPSVPFRPLPPDLPA